MSEADKGNNYEYIFKIILIGNSGVGKSSILQRYIQKVFNESYASTIGVDFFMKSITMGDKSIKMQLWDTAGTEKFRSITTGYYRGADAAFVVFDLTAKATFKALNEWIQSYYKYSNPDVEKNVVLIGNKSDLTDLREVTQEEIDNFTKANNNIKYFEASAKDGINIDECFNYIAEQLMNQHDSKEKEMAKSNDIIKSEKLKENTVVIIGKKKCCF